MSIPFQHATVVEALIATKVVECLLAAGYFVTVDDGAGPYADSPLRHSKDREALLAALCSSGMDTLYVTKDVDARFSGWVSLVYGNMGWDLVSDNTVNLEECLAPATELAESLSE